MPKNLKIPNNVLIYLYKWGYVGMTETKDRTVKTSFTYLTSHLVKLRKVSEETYIPVSAIIRKALDKFFEERDKSNSKE